MSILCSFLVLLQSLTRWDFVLHPRQSLGTRTAVFDRYSLVIMRLVHFPFSCFSLSLRNSFSLIRNEAHIYSHNHHPSRSILPRLFHSTLEYVSRPACISKPVRVRLARPLRVTSSFAEISHILFTNFACSFSAHAHLIS